MKRKQFIKGTSQIAQEGAIQIFQELGGGMEEVIVGVVGTLQFDVLEYRLKNEYGVDIRMEGLPYQYIRWIGGEDVDVKALDLSSDTKRVQDMRGALCSCSPIPEHPVGARSQQGPGPGGIQPFVRRMAP